MVKVNKKFLAPSMLWGLLKLYVVLVTWIGIPFLYSVAARLAFTLTDLSVEAMRMIGLSFVIFGFIFFLSASLTVFSGSTKVNSGLLVSWTQAVIGFALLANHFPTFGGASLIGIAIFFSCSCLLVEWLVKRIVGSMNKLAIKSSERVRFSMSLKFATDRVYDLSDVFVDSVRNWAFVDRVVSTKSLGWSYLQPMRKFGDLKTSYILREQYVLVYRIHLLRIDKIDLQLFPVKLTYFVPNVLTEPPVGVAEEVKNNV